MNLYSFGKLRRVRNAGPPLPVRSERVRKKLRWSNSYCIVSHWDATQLSAAETQQTVSTETLEDNKITGGWRRGGNSEPGAAKDTAGC